MRILLLVSLFFSVWGTLHPKHDSNQPVFLQGIGWEKVENELRKDLRLSPAVRPIEYVLNLTASVRGYQRAERSVFEGTVLIKLNITAYVKQIELHSLGLNISKVRLMKESKVLSNTFSINELRETLVIPSRRSIAKGEKNVHLIIEYQGKARMDGAGLYESWSKPEDSSKLPYISLVTQGEPASARRWFPCFDEPDKKALFQLTVTHPEGTTAYSNTHAESTILLSNGMVSTRFEQTVPLPTYLLALGVTEHPVAKLTVDGYEFRAIGPNRDEAVRSATTGMALLHNYSVFEGVPFFPKKTDILVVEDFSAGAMENPGLITFAAGEENNVKTHVHELAHQYFGNLVTLSTWGDIWVNEGFASFYYGDLQPKHQIWKDDIFCLYDLALHSDLEFTSSIHIEDSFISHLQIHYKRGSQFLRMIRNYVGDEAFDRAIKNYLLKNAYGKGDAAKVIDSFLHTYNNTHNVPDLLERIMQDWIYWPGVAAILVDRFDDRGTETVRITQKRLHSTYFNENLKDEQTVFTIPLFCQIDGKSQTIIFHPDKSDHIIQLPHANSTFTIEDDYGYLFVVWSKLRELPESSSKLNNWLDLSYNLAVSGLISFDEFAESILPFATDPTVQNFIYSIRTEPESTTENRDNWSSRKHECERLGENVLDAPLNDLLPLYIANRRKITYILCSREFNDRELVKRILHDKIIGDDLKIMNIHLGHLILLAEKYHTGVTMEFMAEELQRNPSSLYLRLKMNKIIEVVFAPKGLSSALSELHEFIRLHPSIAAENFDSIVKILEERYVTEEHAKRSIELGKRLRQSIGLAPSRTTDLSEDVLRKATMEDVEALTERRLFKRFNRI